MISPGGPKPGRDAETLHEASRKPGDASTRIMTRRARQDLNRLLVCVHGLQLSASRCDPCWYSLPLRCRPTTIPVFSRDQPCKPRVEGSFAMPMGTEPVRRRMASRLKRAVLQGTSILVAIWLAAFFTPQFHHPLKLAIVATFVLCFVAVAWFFAAEAFSRRSARGLPQDRP